MESTYGDLHNKSTPNLVVIQGPQLAIGKKPNHFRYAVKSILFSRYYRLSNFELNFLEDIDQNYTDRDNHLSKRQLETLAEIVSKAGYLPVVEAE